LAKHLRTPEHSYDNYSNKDDLRLALFSEQHGICCYCMQRIQSPSANKMVIEHFLPQSKFAEHSLDYFNIFASCQGGANGKQKHLYHCDESKGDSIISLNPADKSKMDLIKFTGDGKIVTGIKQYDNEIDNILKLNIQSLREARRVIIVSLENAFSKFKNENVSENFLNKQIEKWNSCTDNFLPELCQVAIYFLQKKRKQIQHMK